MEVETADVDGDAADDSGLEQEEGAGSCAALTALLFSQEAV